MMCKADDRREAESRDKLEKLSEDLSLEFVIEFDESPTFFAKSAGTLVNGAGLWFSTKDAERLLALLKQRP